MTEKERKAEILISLSNFYEALEEENKKYEEQFKYVMNHISELEDENWIEDFKSILDDCSNNFNFRFTYEPIGKLQENYSNIIKEAYVDQYTSGEDNFYGTISIPLTVGKYVTFDYTC